VLGGMTNDGVITVVTGLPRSGTSLMMQMLEAGGLPVLVDRVRAPDADNPRGYYEFEPVKKTRDNAAWLEQALSKAVKLVYRLVYDLPPQYAYRVILMRRDLNEVVASQRVMLERRQKSAGGISDQEMGELYRRDLAEFQAWVRQQPNMTLLEISYNELLLDPQASLQRINALCGEALDTAAMAAVIAPALYRNRA
jgi:uncharacterized protein YcaQ